MVQEYLNEISPTFYGPNKPKTTGKPLRIPDIPVDDLYDHDDPDDIDDLEDLDDLDA